MKKTSQRSLLFRQNVNRTEEWSAGLGGGGLAGRHPNGAYVFDGKIARFGKIT